MPNSGDDQTQVLDALQAFTSAQDLVRESPTPSVTTLARLSANPGEDSAAQDRAAFAEAGLAIVEAATTTGSPETVSRTDQGETLTVESEVTTSTVSTNPDGEEVESSWTDTHRYVLTATGTGYKVVSDALVNDYPPEEQDVGVPRPTADDISSLDDVPAEGIVAMSNTIQPGISTAKFSSYALKYTLFPYNVIPQGNSEFANLGNNCANFASQTLYASGWKLHNGVNQFDTNNWHYNLSGPAGASRTWSKASTLYYYAHTKQSWTKYSSAYSAKTGDLIFVDWDPHGVADGTIDHVMVVSGYVTGVYKGHPNMPLISQKSNNRHNIPLTESIKLAKDGGTTKMNFYALKHK